MCGGMGQWLQTCKIGILFARMAAARPLRFPLLLWRHSSADVTFQTLHLARAPAGGRQCDYAIEVRPGASAVGLPSRWERRLRRNSRPDPCLHWLSFPFTFPLRPLSPTGVPFDAQRCVVVHPQRHVPFELRLGRQRIRQW